MSLHPDKKEILIKYDKFAPWYDMAEGVPEFFGVGKLRRALIGRASGKVLEVGAGTGKNLPYYSRKCEITAVDLSPQMLAIARRRAGKLNLKVSFQVMDGEKLDFTDKSFDTVVDSLSLCTFINPVTALREMSRVCRTDGRILLLEHGRSSRGWLGNLQDRFADRQVKAVCCHWNREPLELVREAGLKIISNRRYFFGIFHVIEATPGTRYF